MKNTLIYLAVLFIVSCGMEEDRADAYGNFEATVITVSSQTPGILKKLNIKEGKAIDSGQYLGYVDTIQFHLQKEQLQTQYRAIQAQSPGISAQVEVLQEQIKSAREEYERFQPLVEKGAATQKQLDDLKNKISLLEKQIAQVRTKNTPLVREVQSVQSRIRQVNHQIENAKIYAPSGGTVLLQLKQEGEVVNTGIPLFRMAKLDTLTLTAYISGSQLTKLQLGQQVQVWVDKDEQSGIQYEGTVRKIAEEAEFTPKTIQTKEERVDLVYATEIAVPNDGKLKIGMPAEVYFEGKKSKDQ